MLPIGEVDDQSSATKLAVLPERARNKIITAFGEAEAKALLGSWRFHARPKQLPPDGDDWFIWLIVTGRGWGKELALDTPIPTPNGWTLLCDLNIGDFVFDETGRPTKVSAVYNTFADDAWRLHFSDGTWIDAGADHQWVTWTHSERKAFLRSVHEEATTRFPIDWPTWRVARCYGMNRLSENRIAPALVLHRAGHSERYIQAITGISRNTFRPHLHAGEYVEHSGRPQVRDGAIGPQIRTTQQIIQTLRQGKRGDLNHCIPVCGSLNLPDIDLPLHPYVLGLWLGDGSSATGAITIGDQDVVESLVRLKSYDASVVRVSNDPGKCQTYSFEYQGERMSVPLRRLGLIGAKHIPSQYLRSSVEQRLLLLRGLMDSDGYAEPSSVEFCTTSKQLCDGFVELARSCGQKPTVYSGRALLYGRDCGPKWRVCWRPTIQVFALTRKMLRVGSFVGRQALRNHHRMIVRAENLLPQPMRCITVTSPNSMYLAGEGMIPTHNTRTAAEWIHARAMQGNERRWIAMISKTPADARDDMMYGPGGIMRNAPEHERPIYNQMSRRVTWPTGSYATIYSGANPEQVRGFSGDTAWCDEVAAWKYPQETWDNLNLGLREPHVASPKVCVTTTPKPITLMRILTKRAREGTGVVMVTGSSHENRANLAPSWYSQVITPLEGTVLGRQEVYGELISEHPDALWTLKQIDDDRVTSRPAEFKTIAVAVDPAESDHEESSETGITVGGITEAEHGYLLADVSLRAKPGEWGQVVVDAYHEFKADYVVVERNAGGDMIAHTIHTIDEHIPIKEVTASRGKHTRAQPVATKSSLHLIHHVGGFSELEDQLVSWVVGDVSPDRLDSYVWLWTSLMNIGHTTPRAVAPILMEQESPWQIG